METVPARETEAAESAEMPAVAPCGDALVLITAPLHMDGHALEHTSLLSISRSAGQAVGEAFYVCDPVFSQLFQGTLTYGEPELGALELEGTDAFRQAIERSLLGDSSEVSCDQVRLIVFPDGYGSVSVRFSIRRGWDRYITNLPQFSPEAREKLCAGLRPMLVGQVNEVFKELSDLGQTETVIPYFNMTYSGDASCELAGMAALQNNFRRLVYPDGPAPLRSSSPWDNQYFYAGFAFFVLLGGEVVRNLEKFGMLLMMLNVLYVRLARTSLAARDALRGETALDIEGLEQLSEQLRAEYQDLVSPTFSFDHHALILRDGIAEAWDLQKLNGSAEDLLDRVRQKLEVKNARALERRNRWLKGGLGTITVLSLVSAVEAAVALGERWF